MRIKTSYNLRNSEFVAQMVRASHWQSGYGFDSHQNSNFSEVISLTRKHLHNYNTKYYVYLSIFSLCTSHPALPPLLYTPAPLTPTLHHLIHALHLIHTLHLIHALHLISYC